MAFWGLRGSVLKRAKPGNPGLTGITQPQQETSALRQAWMKAKPEQFLNLKKGARVMRAPIGVFIQQVLLI